MCCQVLLLLPEATALLLQLLHCLGCFPVQRADAVLIQALVRHATAQMAALLMQALRRRCSPAAAALAAAMQHQAPTGAAAVAVLPAASVWQWGSESHPPCSGMQGISTTLSKMVLKMLWPVSADDADHHKGMAQGIHTGKSDASGRS